MSTKLLVGSGRLYTHAAGTAMPGLSADPVGAGWTDLGPIAGGVRVEREQTLEEHFIDDDTGPVDVTRTAEALVVEANLAEATLARLAAATGADPPSASGGPPPGMTLAAYRGSEVVKLALLFRGNSPEGPGKRAQTYIPRGYFAGDVGLAHRSDELTVIPVEFRALVDEDAPSAAERFGVTVYES